MHIKKSSFKIQFWIASAWLTVRILNMPCWRPLNAARCCYVLQFVARASLSKFNQVTPVASGDNCCNWTRIICVNCDAVRAALGSPWEHEKCVVVWGKWETNKLNTRFPRGTCQRHLQLSVSLPMPISIFITSGFRGELVTLSFSNWQRTAVVGTLPPAPILLTTSLFSNCQIKTEKCWIWLAKR